MDTRTGIALLSAGRIAVGAGLLGATRRTASGWLGRGTTTIPGGRVAVRAVGGRDIGIGAGVDRAGRHRCAEAARAPE